MSKYSTSALYTALSRKESNWRSKDGSSWVGKSWVVTILAAYSCRSHLCYSVLSYIYTLILPTCVLAHKTLSWNEIKDFGALGDEWSDSENMKKRWTEDGNIFTESCLPALSFGLQGQAVHHVLCFKPHQWVEQLETEHKPSHFSTKIFLNAAKIKMYLAVWNIKNALSEWEHFHHIILCNV